MEAYRVPLDNFKLMSNWNAVLQKCGMYKDYHLAPLKQFPTWSVIKQ